MSSMKQRNSTIKNIFCLDTQNLEISLFVFAVHVYNLVCVTQYTVLHHDGNTVCY